MPNPKNEGTGSLSKTRRQNWEERWSKEGFSPFWLGDSFPLEMEYYVKGDWMQPVGRALDIGCGRGELAAGLAAAGHRVVGVDFSSAAIKQAKQMYGQKYQTLTFKNLDICGEDIRQLTRFDYLIDRGCLHVIPDQHWPAFASNVAAISKPRAKLLVLHKKNGMQTEELRHHLRNIFEPNFQEIGFKEIHIGTGPNKKPSLAMEFQKNLLT